MSDPRIPSDRLGIRHEQKGGAAGGNLYCARTDSRRAHTSEALRRQGRALQRIPHAVGIGMDPKRSLQESLPSLCREGLPFSTSQHTDRVGSRRWVEADIHAPGGGPPAVRTYRDGQLCSSSQYPSRSGRRQQIPGLQGAALHPPSRAGA